MKTRQNTIILGLTMYMLIGCSDPNRDALEKASRRTGGDEQMQESPCTTILVGDKDGFGRGFKDGESLYLPGGTPLPLDWRTQDDPTFTDVYPADIDANRNASHVVRFTMTFTPPSDMLSATLHFNTMGIQDGDTQVFNSDTDIRLHIDDVEVPNAFDDIDQFDKIEGKWSDFAGEFDLKVPSNMLNLLQDGVIALRLEIIQTIPGVPSYDGFAIDYCELTLCRGDERW